MTVTRRRFAAGALAAGTLAAAPRSADAVIVLDSTWRAEGGFRAHLALADQPQFASVIALSSDDGQVWGSGSGTWIGNVRGHARILTAAHVFNRGGAADDYVYRAPDGTVMQGTDLVFHPLYNWNNAERTGYDFAIVHLDERIAMRFVGPVPVNQSGAVVGDPNVVPAKVQEVPGGRWLRVQPERPLLIGEYALVEILSPTQMSPSVWDFQVNPATGDNPGSMSPILGNNSAQ